MTATGTADVEWEDLGPDTLFHPRTDRGRAWLSEYLDLDHYGAHVLEDSADESSGIAHRDITIDLMQGDGLTVARA